MQVTGSGAIGKGDDLGSFDPVGLEDRAVGVHAVAISSVAGGAGIVASVVMLEVALAEVDCKDCWACSGVVWFVAGVTLAVAEESFSRFSSRCSASGGGVFSVRFGTISIMVLLRKRDSTL